MGDYGTKGAGEFGGTEENFHCERPPEPTPLEITPTTASPEPLNIEKPEGMTEKAKVMFDKMSEVKSEPKISSQRKPKTLQSRINRIENKLQCKMNKIIKRRRKNKKAKDSRRKNRK